MRRRHPIMRAGTIILTHTSIITTSTADMITAMTIMVTATITKAERRFFASP